MPPELLADVAVDARIDGIEPVFTYRVPLRLRAAMRPGQLVWVPLRRQHVQGIVLDLYVWGAEQADALPDEQPPPDLLLEPDRDSITPVLRDIVDVADAEATLTRAQIRLARRIVERYRTPLYEALSLMLPTGVSQDSEPTWRATPAGIAADLGALPEAERAVLYYLRQRGELTEQELRRTLRGSDTTLREIYSALCERGLIVRGTALNRPRARPLIERLARLRVLPPELDTLIQSLSGAPKQLAVLELLRAAYHTGDPDDRPAEHAPLPPVYPVRAIYAATGANLATLRALEQRGLIELSSREVRRDPLAGDSIAPDIPPILTIAQERSWRPIVAALDQSNPAHVSEGFQNAPSRSATEAGSPTGARSFMLHGVTGSGKTELYLRAIGRAIRLGRQSLVLVPEIALTTQLVRRFAARFPGQIAVLHSELSAGERYDEWRRLRRGEAMLAVGSRSAVFAPLPALGLVIVDEEHETSFKHDGTPRYHARDVAHDLAELTGSVLILGSATPSVESYAAARAGRITLIELSERVGMGRDPITGLPRSHALPLPPVRVVDMRRELQQGNRSIFSRPLQDALAGAIERHEQAILFLNRRGAAAFMMCRDCGHVVPCPNCSSPLVLHYDEQNREREGSPGMLLCHSCGHCELQPALCPQCWSTRVKTFGIGTQRVVEEVERLFPGARPLRWDRDSVSRKGDHARMLDQFLRHDADVLVGTQMIAKGLDLPLVSVVGVVAADTGLYLPDFRAGERTFQLLTQVAGRAGRRSGGAQVVLQTYTPDHYALRAAQEHDYKLFYEQEIAFRRQIGYPPFGRLVRFVYAGGTDERSRKAAEELAAEVRRLAVVCGLENWGLIGPAPAFFHVQRNRYRWHLLLRSADPAPLLAVLRLPPGWALDVDPVHVL